MYKRQVYVLPKLLDEMVAKLHLAKIGVELEELTDVQAKYIDCLLYTSDAADERSSVDLGGSRLIKKKK